MATRKNGTRFTDRNRIKQMHRQGYDLEQICTAVSIVSSVVQDVIDGSFDKPKGKVKPTAEQVKTAQKIIALQEEVTPPETEPEPAPEPVAAETTLEDTTRAPRRRNVAGANTDG